MPDDPIRHDFDHAPAPGGGFPPLIGDPTEEFGPEGGLSVINNRSELARGRYPTMQRWYAVGSSAWLGANSTILNKTNYAANTLYAWPFPSNEGGLIYQIAIWATTAWAAGEDARIGIYQSTSIRNIYPGRLAFSLGETTVGASSGQFTHIVNQGLEPQRVYWAAIVFDATTTGQILGVNLSTVGVLGWADPSAAANPGHGLSVAFTYGELPAVYPAGATISSGTPLNNPVIFMMFKEGL